MAEVVFASTCERSRGTPREARADDPAQDRRIRARVANPRPRAGAGASRTTAPFPPELPPPWTIERGPRQSCAMYVCMVVIFPWPATLRTTFTALSSSVVSSTTVLPRGTRAPLRVSSSTDCMTLAAYWLSVSSQCMSSPSSSTRSSTLDRHFRRPSFPLAMKKKKAAARLVPHALFRRFTWRAPFLLRSPSPPRSRQAAAPSASVPNEGSGTVSTHRQKTASRPVWHCGRPGQAALHRRGSRRSARCTMSDQPNNQLNRHRRCRARWWSGRIALGESHRRSVGPFAGWTLESIHGVEERTDGRLRG